MTARDFLCLYREYQHEANRRKAAYERASEKTQEVRSILGHTDEPHIRSYKSREDALIDVQCKREAWQFAELDALDIRQQVFGAINSLHDQDEADVLYQRYILLKEWEKVAECLGVGLTQTHRTHRKALADLQEIIDNNVVISDA